MPQSHCDLPLSCAQKLSKLSTPSLITNFGAGFYDRLSIERDLSYNCRSPVFLLIMYDTMCNISFSICNTDYASKRCESICVSTLVIVQALMFVLVCVSPCTVSNEYEST